MSCTHIADITATTISVPLKALLRHSNGAHWGRFLRTVDEVTGANGLSGFGELGGGGASVTDADGALKPCLLGHDPLQVEQRRRKITNPVGSLYNARAQLHAAVEMACIDLAGKRLGISPCDLMGGAIRKEIRFMSYLFYRYRNPETGAGGEKRPDDTVTHARTLKLVHGFYTHKLTGGHFGPTPTSR